MGKLSEGTPELLGGDICAVFEVFVEIAGFIKTGSIGYLFDCLLGICERALDLFHANIINKFFGTSVNDIFSDVI
jgi:hypothetical protein